MSVVLLLLVLAGLDQPQQTFIWGGNHVELEMTARGATLEFDCARGALDSSLRPDDKGNFVVKGTFTPERSGPSRDDDPRPLNATYSGTIKGDAMTLTMVVDGQDPKGAIYELTRGRRGNIRKCR